MKRKRESITDYFAVSKRPRVNFENESTSVVQRNMPAYKRKRSYGRSYRRSYKRRGGISTRSVLRAITKLDQGMGPFGEGSEHYAKYGPSKRQMLEKPGRMITRDQMRNRIMDRYYGDGDYTSIGHWGSRLGGAALGAMQGFASGGIPGAVGGIAPGWERGANFSKSMGWGDYSSPRVTNQIVAGSGDTGIVINDSDLSGDVVLTNREFVGNVVSSASGSALNLAKYGINPANSTTFPFLSNIAKNFELYEWQGLGFQYIPTSGEGADQTLGKVIMVTNYDPGADSWSSSTSLSTLQNYDYASSCKPSVGMFHGVETNSDKRVVKQMYIDGTDDSSSRDPIFRTLGNFYVGVQGLTATTAAVTVGELWVTYRVKLSRMRLAGELYGFNDGFYSLSGRRTQASVTVLEQTMNPYLTFNLDVVQRLNEQVNDLIRSVNTSNRRDTLLAKVEHHQFANGSVYGVNRLYLTIRRSMLSLKSRIYVMINYLLQAAASSSYVTSNSGSIANAITIDVTGDSRCSFVNSDTLTGIFGHDGPRDNGTLEAGVTRVVCFKPVNYYDSNGNLDNGDIVVTVDISHLNITLTGSAHKHDIGVRVLRVNGYGEYMFSNFDEDDIEITAPTEF